MLVRLRRLLVGLGMQMLMFWGIGSTNRKNIAVSLVFLSTLPRPSVRTR